MDNSNQPPQAPETQSQVPSINNNSSKSKFVPIVVGMIAVLVIAIGAYILIAKQSQPDIQNTDQTANLKTYMNKEYLIKFDIPANWSIKEYENGVQTEYELLSEDKLIMISSDIDHNKGYNISNYNTFPKINPQLGKYNNLNYGRYHNNENEVVYRIDLYSTFIRQKNIFVYVTVKGDFKKNHERVLTVLKTFAFTKQEPLLEEFFTYKIPSGWTVKSKNPSHSLSLNSPDAEYDGGSPYLKKGAKIYISGGRLTKKPKDGISFLPDNEQLAEYKKQTISIGDIKGINIFHCWEGCSDSYSVITDNYYVTIDFDCPDFCNSKADTDASVYAKDRDYFLNSIKFK